MDKHPIQGSSNTSAVRASLAPNGFTFTFTLLALFLFRYQRGDKALGQCLSAINGSVFNQNTGMRSNSKKVLFIVTTGKSWSGIHPLFPVKWIKKHGVEIFGLTIGHKKNALEQLQEIASDPVEKHVFWVKELQDIHALSTMLKGKGEYKLHRVPHINVI